MVPPGGGLYDSEVTHPLVYVKLIGHWNESRSDRSVQILLLKRQQQ